MKPNTLKPVISLIVAMAWFTTMPNEWLRYAVMPVFMILVQFSFYKRRKRIRREALNRLGKRYARPDFWLFLAGLSVALAYYLWKLYNAGHAEAYDMILYALFGHFLCTHIIFRERYYLSIMSGSFILHYPSSNEVYFDEIASVEYSPSEYVLTAENSIYRIKLSELNEGEAQLLRQFMEKMNKA